MSVGLGGGGDFIWGGEVGCEDGEGCIAGELEGDCNADELSTEFRISIRLASASVKECAFFKWDSVLSTRANFFPQAGQA